MKSRIDAMDSFDVTLTASDQSRHIVQCGRRLRAIAGRRSVFDGTYGGRPVVVKQFGDVFNRFRCRREQRGLERLRRCGLAAPEVLLSGKDDKGHDVLVIEKIENAVDVLDALKSAQSPQVVESILVAIVRYVARMHQAGVVQLDLHTGNFLVSGSEIYAIDAAKLKFRPKPISIDDSCRQLAMLLTGIPARFLEQEPELLRLYCRTRGLNQTSDWYDRLQTLKARRRKAYLPKALKKTLRNSKRFFVLKERNYRGVFYKEAFDAESARRLIELLENHEAGDERTFILDFEGVQYEVMQFKPKHKLEALRWRLFGSPARRRWLEAWKRYYIDQDIQLPAAIIKSNDYLITMEIIL